MSSTHEPRSHACVCAWPVCVRVSLFVAVCFPHVSHRPSVCAALEFDLDVDAAEELEYAPRQINMQGASFPSWMMEGSVPQAALTHTRALAALCRRLFLALHADGAWYGHVRMRGVVC